MLINLTEQRKRDEEEVKSFVESLDLPEMVRQVNVTFGESYDGDPAMFITLLVRSGDTQEASEERVALIVRVQSALLPLSGDRWPYVECRVEGDEPL